MYKATVNKEHVFDMNADEKNQLVNNQPVDFDCRQLPNGDYHIILDSTSMVASVISINRNTKEFELRIDGKNFVVEIEDDFDQLLSRMGMDKFASQQVSEVKSPMPGLVLDIKIAVGDTVVKDQTLMVLEAMKMENVIAAPCDAVIATIEVVTQEKVDKNQLLIKFE